MIKVMEVIVVLLSVVLAVASCASLNINWGTSIATATGMQYGSNDFPQSAASTASAQATYASRINQLKLPVIRVLDGRLDQRWLTNGQWDSNKISVTYNVFDMLNPRPVIVQNIPHPITGYDSSTNVISDSAAYATYCANLVRVINIQMNKNVIYWEPMNELDDHYYWNNMGKLYTILKEVSNAMKAVDPRIKIVAPALSTLFSFGTYNFQQNKIDTLLDVFPEVDVISWHRYAEPQSWDYSNDVIMQVTPYYHMMCQTTTDRVFAKTGRRIPIFLDEYNLAAYSSKQEPRTHEVYSVAFFASMHKHMVEGGCDWGASWNIWDTYYGLMNGSFVLAPPSQIFTLSNTYMKGTVYSSSSDDAMVEVFAVKSTTSRNVYVINKSNSVKTVTLTATNGAFGNNGLTRITAGDSTTPVTDSLPAATPVTLSVKPYNVILLIDSTPAATPEPTPVPTPAPGSYIGCIQDGNPGSLLAGAYQRDPSNTPARCVAFCASRNFAYSGLSYTYCFCDNQYPTANIGAESACSQKCAGDATKFCGGPNYHTSIYHS